jgi:hypothetical protein
MFTPGIGGKRRFSGSKGREVDESWRVGLRKTGLEKIRDSVDIGRHKIFFP